VRWDYENVLKISILLCQAACRGTKINIIAFQNEEAVLSILQRPSLLLDVSGDKASTTWNTGYFSCDCHQDQKLADYY
jgi:hypothetical protein